MWPEVHAVREIVDENLGFHLAGWVWGIVCVGWQRQSFGGMGRWRFTKRQGRGVGVRPEMCPRGGILQYRLTKGGVAAMHHTMFCISNNHRNPLYVMHSSSDKLKKTLKELRVILHTQDKYKKFSPRVFAWHVW
jgi:hypothetical protein